MKRYNLDNRALDKFNQNITYYNVERKCRECWKKIIFFIIEISISNSKILTDIIYGDTKINYLSFKISLFKELLKEINSKKGEINSILRQNTFFEKLYDIEKIKVKEKDVLIVSKMVLEVKQIIKTLLKNVKRNFILNAY